MTARKPMFPFSLPEYQATRWVELDDGYKEALRRQCVGARLDRLEIYTNVQSDKTMRIWAWCSTTGFALCAGRFWEKTVTLTDEQFSRYIDKELQRRALAEIEEEETMKLKIRVSARMDVIRNELLSEKVAP